MVTRRNAWFLGLGTALAAALAACGQKAEQGTTPVVEEKTFNLAPTSSDIKASFLAGTLQDMKVIERVEQGTGKIVDSPRLHATLKLKNTSQDQTARLLAGKIDYMNNDGKPVSPAEGRRDTTFTLSSYQSDRLDPGKEISQDIDVPFPSAALKEHKLRDIRLDLTYIPMPYKQETMQVQVSLGG